jgi:hypothetical protein
VKQIQVMDDNKTPQYFKSCHVKQTYSLNGYFHISSILLFDELFQLTPVAEWLEAYRCYIHLCPSQNKEMVKIGTLVYSSILTFRDHLKQAIMSHPLWQPSHSDPTPIFDIFVSELVFNGKQTKMLFDSDEKSRQDDVMCLFKLVCDGTPKKYPNGYIMLFIPIQDLINSTPEFQSKITFNHKRYICEEAMFSIGGLNDLNTIVTLKNEKKVSIRTLLQSIPASEGMSHPSYFNRLSQILGLSSR